MRKIKIYAITSLDGFTARLDGDTDWVLDYPELSNNSYGFREFFDNIDGAIFDQQHYYLVLSNDILWPFANKPCYIVSDEEFYTSPDKNISFMLTTEYLPAEHVKALQQTEGGDIWLAGNYELIAQLMGHGMVDELIINIFPLFIGKGQALFSHCQTEYRWQLVKSKQFDNGVVQVHYKK